jgi:hypothetical protein
MVYNFLPYNLKRPVDITDPLPPKKKEEQKGEKILNLPPTVITYIATINIEN